MQPVKVQPAGRVPVSQLSNPWSILVQISGVGVGVINRGVGVTDGVGVGVITRGVGVADGVGEGKSAGKENREAKATYSPPARESW